MKKASSFKKISNFWIISSLLLSLILINLTACKVKHRYSTSGYPIKTAAYWTCPTMTIPQADSLSLHDLVIICIENQFNNYEVLQHLKKLNPQIKLLGYYNAPEMWENTNPILPWQSTIIKEITEKRSTWLLKTNLQEQVIFWPEMEVLNISTACPPINGEIYSEWIAGKLNREIFSDSIWDGHFLDNGGGNLFWLNDRPENTVTGKIDANQDGQVDNQNMLNGHWFGGIKKYLELIRQAQGPDFIIIANKGSLDFTNLVNGKFFENFPNNYLGSKQDDGWQQCLSNAKKLGPYTIFQVQVKDLNFGLASTLLLDNVYLAVGQDNAHFYQQFVVNLGTATSVAKKTKEGNYLRSFTQGSVIVYPHNRQGKIKCD